MPESIPDHITDLPPGARVIEPEDAIKAIIAGDHADATTARDLALDRVLIVMIRNGEIVTVRQADGKLAFTIREI